MNLSLLEKEKRRKKPTQRELVLIKFFSKQVVGPTSYPQTFRRNFGSAVVTSKNQCRSTEKVSLKTNILLKA